MRRRFYAVSKGIMVREPHHERIKLGELKNACI